MFETTIWLIGLYGMALASKKVYVLSANCFFPDLFIISSPGHDLIVFLVYFLVLSLN